jgi:hypothetical protein
LGRDDLKDITGYTGAISYACFRAQGNASALVIAGTTYTLDPRTYVLAGTQLNVDLVNTVPGNGNGNNAMGQWELRILSSSADACLDACRTCGRERANE